MESITLSVLSDVSIDVEKIKKDINGSNNDMDVNCCNCASFECLDLQTDFVMDSKDFCGTSINLLNGMDAFGLRKGLKHIIMSDKQYSWSPFDQQSQNKFVQLVNKFVQKPYDDDTDGNCNKLMNRKRLTIKIENFVGSLTPLDEYIVFLSEHKDQMNLLGIFETITIEFCFPLHKHSVFQQTARGLEMRLQRMQVFDVNCREVMITGFDFDRSLVDQVIVDIIDWLHRVKDKQIEMKKRENRFDCQVVFEL